MTDKELYNPDEFQYSQQTIYHYLDCIQHDQHLYD